LASDTKAAATEDPTCPAPRMMIFIYSPKRLNARRRMFFSALLGRL
jgi:hypothetical protein